MRCLFRCSTSPSPRFPIGHPMDQLDSNGHPMDSNGRPVESNGIPLDAWWTALDCTGCPVPVWLLSSYYPVAVWLLSSCCPVAVQLCLVHVQLPSIGETMKGSTSSTELAVSVEEESLLTGDATRFGRRAKSGKGLVSDSHVN